MDQVIRPVSPEMDLLDRVAARHGLHCAISGHNVFYSDHGSRVDREATDQELDLWRALVPSDVQGLCDRVWLSADPPVLPAIPEEVYSSVLFHDVTYVSAADLCALRGLPCFSPCLSRSGLLDGHVGFVHGRWRVFVSRLIPVGYFHVPDSGGRTEVLHPRRPSGNVREILPPVPEADLWSVDVRPMLVTQCYPDFLEGMHKVAI